MTCPAASQTWKRAAVETRMLDTVTLRNPGPDTRGSGGGIVKGTPIDTSATGRLQQTSLSGNVREVATRLQLLNPAVWHFPYSQAGLTEKTVILFGTRTFNVQAVDKNGALGVEVVAVCEEIKR